MSEECWIFRESKVDRLDELIMLGSTAAGYGLMFLSMIGILDMWIAMIGMAIPFVALPLLTAWQKVHLAGFRALSLTLINLDGERYYRDIIVAGITPLPEENEEWRAYKVETLDGHELVLALPDEWEKCLLFSPGSVLRGGIEVELPVADVYGRLMSVDGDVPRISVVFSSGMSGPVELDVRENINKLLLDLRAELVDLKTKAEFLTRENMALEAALALAQARAIANIRYTAMREKRERINTAILAMLAGLVGFFIAFLLL